MRTLVLTVPEVVFIAATRGALGFGAGDRCRRDGRLSEEKGDDQADKQQANSRGDGISKRNQQAGKEQRGDPTTPKARHLVDEDVAQVEKNLAHDIARTESGEVRRRGAVK